MRSFLYLVGNTELVPVPGSLNNEVRADLKLVCEDCAPFYKEEEHVDSWEQSLYESVQCQDCGEQVLRSK